MVPVAGGVMGLSSEHAASSSSDAGRNHVKRDGMIANGRVFFDATSKVKEGNGLPDGLKLDKQGNLFATGPGGVFVFTPKGKHLGTIDTGQPTGNCAWGDDGSTLYIMANHWLSRIKTS